MYSVTSQESGLRVISKITYICKYSFKYFNSVSFRKDSRPDISDIL